MIWAIVSVGVASGLAGMSLALLLRTIQHWAYGGVQSNFLSEVIASPPEHRFMVLLLCGAVGGLGWWILRCYFKPLVKIEKALEGDPKSMPFGSTVLSDLIQIVTVALGSPLGREGAPREMGALFANQILKKAHLSLEDTRLMVASGAGAGLAAVYNVPLGGALFALEVLLRKFSWRFLAIALSTSMIATVVSWWGLGNQPQYPVTFFTFSPSWLVGSLIGVPIFWWAGRAFAWVLEKLRARAPTDWKLPVFCFLNFAFVGALAMFFPAILGNGKSAAGLEFADMPSFQMGLILLVLRVVITCSSVGVGAMGGMLTPSVAVGGLLGGSLGLLWSSWWPGSPFSSFALVGAALFLGAAQKMPITAMVLVFELTHVWFKIA